MTGSPSKEKEYGTYLLWFRWRLSRFVSKSVKEIESVANITHRDVAEFLPLAAEIPIRRETEVYPLEKANQALMDLRQGGTRGAKVLLLD